MKTIVLLFFVFPFLFMNGQSVVWDKIFKEDQKSVTHQLITKDQNLIFAGSHYKDLGNGTYEQGIYVQKLDFEGISKWKKVLVGNRQDVAIDLLEDEDGGIVLVSKSTSDTGFFDSHYGSVFAGPLPSYDFWLTRIDSEGNIIYKKHIGGSGEETLSKIIKYNNGFLLAVNTNSTDYDFPNSESTKNDVWLLNYSNNGDLIWKNRIIGSENEVFANLKILNNEICVLVNSQSNNGDFNGNNLTNSNIGYIIKLNPLGEVTQSLPVISSTINNPIKTMIGDAHYADGKYFIFGTEAVGANGSKAVINAYKEDGTFIWKNYQGNNGGDVNLKSFIFQNNNIIALSSSVMAPGGYRTDISIYDMAGNVKKENQSNDVVSDVHAFPNGSFCVSNYVVGNYTGHPYFHSISFYNNSYNFIKKQSVSSATTSSNFHINSINQDDVYLFYNQAQPSGNTTPDSGLHIIKMSLVDLLSVKNGSNLPDVKIFPNPSSDFLTISKMANELVIFNAQGQLIKTYQNVDKIKVEELNKGIYVIKAIINGKHQVFKFIKR